MKLSIGMAVFNDFDGAYFSIQAIRMYHMQSLDLLIVDQSTNPAHSSAIQSLCANSGARYFQMQTPVGTSQSRNRVFQEALGEFVICMDSHVLLGRGAIENLLWAITNNKIGEDIYSGPMLMDDLKGFCTHFNPEWRAEMYGTWGRAWQCVCREFNFSCRVRNDRVEYVSLPEAREVVSHCPKCKEIFPSLGWSAHEKALVSLGYYSLGESAGDEPFAIPGQGLGLFGCRKDAWLGFHPNAIGFGAEELNIHELYRQRGRQAICLPYLKWLHRFGRPSGIPYPLNRYDKVRNYVLWHNLLGKPLDDIEQHFVATRLISREQWEHLIADPINHFAPPSTQGCQTCGSQPAPKEGIASVEDAFEFSIKLPRDFDQHMQTLRTYADKCEHVTEFSIRRESTIALCASQAKTVLSFNSERHDSLVAAVKKLRGDSFIQKQQEIEDPDFKTDLLFINDKHTANRVIWLLEKYGLRTSHYIVLHNTTIYGERGEDSTAGIMHAVRAFLKQHPEWTVIEHSLKQYGLTVLSRDPADKKQLPGIARQAANFAKALSEHVASGMQHASTEIMESRLNICMTCPQRNDMNCGACGCNLLEKTKWASSECPLAFWHSVVR